MEILFLILGKFIISYTKIIDFETTKFAGQ
jgi:hypothetical protein